MTRLSFALLLSLLLPSLAGCGGDRERNEAVLFLDRLDQLDTPSDQARGERIESLSTLPIATPGVAEVRDHCVRLHRALLTAEETSAGVRGALADSTEDGAHAPSAAAARALEEALDRSNRALEEARTERSACMDGAAALRTRFGVRRP
jgi:Flp pilus assembly protein TadD